MEILFVNHEYVDWDLLNTLMKVTINTTVQFGK